MPVRTLNELFFQAAETHDKPDAFLDRSGGSYHPFSHRQALEAVEELSLGLIDLGVQPGERVAIFAESSLNWAMADFAILTAAAINVPIYPTIPPGQVAYILKDSAARFVFVSNAAHRAGLDEIRRDLRPDLVVISFEPLPESGAALLDLAELRRRGRERRAREPGLHRARAATIRSEDLASIIYTSGTTGTPKGVMLTHGNIVSNVVAALNVLPFGPSDTYLSFLPLCHIFERMAGHYTMYYAGASIAYAESMDTVPQNLIEVRPTIVISVPRLYEKMHARVIETVAASPPLRQRIFRWGTGVGRRRSLLILDGRKVPGWLDFQYRLVSKILFSRLKERTGGRVRFMVSGGAPLSSEIALFFHAAGLTILEGYGLTETSPVVAFNRIDRIKLGTVGQPFPGVEVRIAPDGEILVRGPGVMKGYFNHPEATAEAVVDGWFYTGDIGYLDRDGFLTITDRKKDLIVTAGGKNVAPQPVENKLKEDPYIAEAVLVGDKRPYIVALIVPDFAHLDSWAREQRIAGDSETLCRDPRVVDFYTGRVKAVNEGLAPFEQIKRVGLIDRELTVVSGELTPTLKVKRRVIGERFRQLIESLYDGAAGIGRT